MGSVTNDRIYFLDLGLNPYTKSVNGRILSSRADGSDLQELVTGLKHLPDGIAIDAAKRHIYWTNMGTSPATPNDGSIQRCDLEGNNITTIVPPGQIHTPKQLTLVTFPDSKSSLFWCDREGMRVMRCDLDGSNLEVLVQTGSGPRDRADARNWCVGIAVDTSEGMMYWTQKGPSKGSQGRIFRAPVKSAVGEVAGARTDIEVLAEGLPEPIDLEFDERTNTLYWTDRGDPPFGNTVNSMRVDVQNGADAKRSAEKRILTNKLHEGTGLTLDKEHNRMFFSDILGGVYTAIMDGSGKTTLHQHIGDCTGIAYLPDMYVVKSHIVEANLYSSKLM